MRNIFLGTVLLAFAAAAAANAADLKTAPLFKAPPAPATPAATGYLEVYTGWASTENSTNEFVPGIGSFPNSDKLDGWPIGGAGRANYWFMPNASVQIDAQAEGTSYRETFLGTTDHFSTLAYLVAGHVNVRNQEVGLLGLFGGAGGNGLAFSSVRHGVFGARDNCTGGRPPSTCKAATIAPSVSTRSPTIFTPRSCAAPGATSSIKT